MSYIIGIFGSRWPIYYVCELVLGFFTWSETNQCRKILWRVNINNYQKKILSFRLTVAKVTFPKTAITFQRNEICMCKTSIWRYMRKRVWPLCGAIIGQKHKNGYNYAPVCPIDLKTHTQCLCPKCHGCLWARIGILKNMVTIGQWNLFTYNGVNRGQSE